MSSEMTSPPPVVAAPTPPPACPECGTAEPRTLSRDGDIQRYECAACSHTFHGPAAPEAAAPAAAPPPFPSYVPSIAHLEIAPPEPDAGAALIKKCRKCGKPYKRGGAFITNHEAACDGTPWQVAADSGAPRDVRPRLSGAMPSSAAPTPEPEVTKAIRLSIDALKYRRLSLEREIGALNAAMRTLESTLLGAGGSPESPFPAGA